jgi:hypothetical protein
MRSGMVWVPPSTDTAGGEREGGEGGEAAAGAQLQLDPYAVEIAMHQVSGKRSVKIGSSRAPSTAAAPPGNPSAVPPLARSRPRLLRPPCPCAVACRCG